MTQSVPGGQSDCYFAFGSNMNPARMAQRGLRSTAALSGWLDHYALVFDKVSSRKARSAHANIRWAPGQRVEGVVYRLIDSAEIAGLDRFEGTPRTYSRELFPIETAGGVLWAWTYVANPAFIAEGLGPEQEYLDHLLAGAPMLSDSYVRMLERVETF